MARGNGVWLAALILLLSLAVALAAWWLGAGGFGPQAGGDTGGGASLFGGEPLELRLTRGARALTIQDRALIAESLRLLEAAPRVEGARLDAVATTLVYVLERGGTVTVQLYRDQAQVEPGGVRQGPALTRLGEWVDAQLWEREWGARLAGAAAAERPSVTAQDLGLRLALTAEQQAEIVRLLGQVEVADPGSPVGGFQYPAIRLLLGPETVSLLNSRYALAGMQVLRVPPQLWPTVTAWLPPETPEPGSLRSLFFAEAMHLDADLGEPQRPRERVVLQGPDPGALTRMHKVVRLLLAGSPTDQEAGEATGKIGVTVGGRYEEVALGPDWFAYQGQRYAVPNLSARLLSLLHAG